MSLAPNSQTKVGAVGGNAAAMSSKLNGTSSATSNR